MTCPAHTQLAPISRLVRRGLLGFDYELMLENTYSSLLQPGDLVADVGAHTGRHLFKFAQLVGKSGRVAAFEPLPDKFDFLTRRSEELGLTNVRLFNLALSNFEGRSSFVHAVGTPEESGLKQRIYNVPDRANPIMIEVTVSRLDMVLSDITRLDYIKMDIEGAELDCISGAQSLIERFRPFMSVEFGHPSYCVYGKTPYDLLQFVNERGYIIFDIFCIEYKTEEDFVENVDGFFWDYFLVPIEKRDLFVGR